jgi:hypothetical protein
MSTPIVRLFADESRAREALLALREARFAQDDITLLLPAQVAGADAANSLDSLVSAILGGAAPRGAAKTCADAVRAGESMVAVRAPWGSALAAIRALEKHGAARDPMPVASEPALTVEDSTPLSSALRLPVLWRKTPMPLSNLFGLEDLAPSKPILGGLVSHRFAVFGEPRPSRNPAPLSSLFGLPTLTRGGKAFFGGLVSHTFHLFGAPRLQRNPAPLSTMLGWPPLKAHPRAQGRAAGPVWDDAAPLSSALRLPVLVRPEELAGSGGRPENLAASRPWFGDLASHRFALFGEPRPSRNPAPFSSLFGLPTLTRGGKPFFGGLARHRFYLFGEPRLSRNPSPLSSLLGLGSLTRD